MSAVDEAAIAILKAKAKEASAKAGQSVVFAVYMEGTLQQDVSPVARILEHTLTKVAIYQAEHERQIANYLAEAVRGAEEAHRKGDAA